MNPCQKSLLCSFPIPKVFILLCPLSMILGEFSPNRILMICTAPKTCPDLYIAESAICANSVPSNILGGCKQLSQLLQLSISSSK